MRWLLKEDRRGRIASSLEFNMKDLREIAPLWMGRSRTMYYDRRRGYLKGPLDRGDGICMLISVRIGKTRCIRPTEDTGCRMVTIKCERTVSTDMDRRGRIDGVLSGCAI